MSDRGADPMAPYPRSRVSQAELDAALDAGEVADLPDNQPMGILGDRGFDVRKVDTFDPTLNAGIVQESSFATRQLTMILLYVLVITGPVAAWLLWRDPRRPLWAKVLWTVLGVAGYIGLWVLYTFYFV